MTSNSYILNALIIDDEIDICYLLSSILKKNNFKTAFVNKLNDATTALERDIPNLVFLDNHLPDGMGIDYIHFIKSNFPQSKVIMISAYDSYADKQKALKNGADLFIGKPFSLDSINNAISTLFA